MLIVPCSSPSSLLAGRRSARHAGDTASVQAGTHYYIGTRATTIFAMRSRGPFTLTYVHPGDDPSRHLPLGR